MGFVKEEGWKLADRQEEIHLQEQAYLEAAHLLLDLEENFLKRSTGESGTEIFSATVLRKMWKRRLENLRDSRERLVLGAFERTIDGEICNFHVGRFNVEIEDDHLVYFEAPEAEFFYQGIVDGKSLNERRTITVQHQIVSRVEVEGKRHQLSDTKREKIVEVEGKRHQLNNTKREKISDFASDKISTDLRGADSLLDAMLEERTGQMKEMVATIQAEQDKLVRSDYLLPVLIEGGPGTGKTIIGLHRVSSVLFRIGNQIGDVNALVIGPSDKYVAYVENVLPQLGKRSAIHRSVESLCLRRLPEKDRVKVRVCLNDPIELEIIKSSIAMRTIIRKALLARIQFRPIKVSELGITQWILEDQVETGIMKSFVDFVNGVVTLDGVKVGLRRWLANELSPGINAAILNRRAEARKNGELAEKENLNMNPIFREIGPKGLPDLNAAIRAIVNDLLPNVSALDVLQDLHTRESDSNTALSKHTQTSHSKSVLSMTSSETTLLQLFSQLGSKRERSRAKKFRISQADLALLDEISSAMTTEAATRFAHVMVDEAQDLTALEWCVIGRLVSGASVTVLGDYLQRTRFVATRNWDEICLALGIQFVKPVKLETSYRVPAPILSMASKIVPKDERGAVPKGLRSGAQPRTISIKRPAGVSGIRSILKELPPGLVGIISSDTSLTELGSEFVVVIDPRLAKGLEFDHVIVVDPNAWADSSPEGQHLKYIAFTRATRTLTVVNFH